MLTGSPLRKCTGEEDCAAVLATSSSNQEGYILATFELAGDLSEVFFAIHRLSIYLQDHITGGKLYIVRKGIRLYLRDLNAFALWGSESLCHFGGNRADA